MPLRDSTAAEVAAVPDAVPAAGTARSGALTRARAVLEQWRRGGRAVATLGVGSEGPVTIDLVRDGPHVLVAGTTGAGKSELLALARDRLGHNKFTGRPVLHPDRLQGRGCIRRLRPAAARGRVRHRPRRAIGPTRNRIAAGRAAPPRSPTGRGRSGRPRRTIAPRAGQQRQPLGRLVIVVDEFATLADELPDLIGSLLAIARRGRSLGLHLVLATQRPAGAVSPEIQANLALRIALRVTDPAESMAIIGSAAAAGIDPAQPGRAIVRAGSTLREFQTARVGLPPVGGRGAVRVELLDDWGRPIEAAPPIRRTNQ